MTCRDVLCHENGQLDSGVCVSVGASFVDTCSSIFLKLTPVPGQRQLRKRFIQTSYFLMNFLREIGVNNQDNNEGTTDSGVWTTSSVSYSSNEFGPERFERSAESYGVLQKLRIFFKTEKHNYIHYIVVQLINHFKDTKQKYEFLDNIKPFMILYYNGELSARFSIELTSFKFNSIDDRTTVSVPRNAGKEVDELVSDFDAIYGLECDSDTITELTKIQRCPYVILDLKGITMRVNNDVITVFDNGEIPRILKVFSKWEYENHNGSLYICFQDYLDIYYSSFSKIAHKTMVADSPKIISNVWLDLVYLLLTFICI